MIPTSDRSGGGEWDAVFHVGTLLDSKEESFRSLLLLAQQDPAAFKQQTVSAGIVDWWPESDVVEPVDALVIAAEQTGCIWRLELPATSEETLAKASLILEHRGLPGIDLADMERIEDTLPDDESQVGLEYFDIKERLDGYLTGRRHRLVTIDDGTDSVLFTVVEARSYDELMSVELEELRLF